MKKDIKIRYKQNKRIFTLFCALALIEHNKNKDCILKVNPQYYQIQKALKKRCAVFSSKFLAYFKKDHYIQYLVWVLRHSDFPGFKLITKNKDSIQHIDSWFAGFDKIIKEFYFKAGIDDLWNNIQIKNKQTVKWYEQKTKKTVQQIIDIFKNDNLFFQEICIIPNLLETRGAGCGPLIKPTAYIVFGHTFKKNQDCNLIVHELLHSVVNPLIDSDIELQKEFYVFEKLYQEITTADSRKYYPVWQWIGYEYLVKITHADIMTKGKREKYFKLENSWGFPKVEEFYKIYDNCKTLSKSYKETILNTLKAIATKY